MTREEINVLDYEELETRAAEIAKETAEADKEKLETLNEELDAIAERRAALDLEVETRKKAAAAVVNGAGLTIEEKDEENKPMEVKEYRNTPEYIEAFAKSIRTGKEIETRDYQAGVISEAGGGFVPVPEFVEEKIHTAWENDKVFSRVSKSYLPGILKVGVEESATGAVPHGEGDDAPEMETLELVIVEMIPFMLKKWITITDEILALSPYDFLAYLYDEFAYQIVKAVADGVVNAIQTSPTTSTTGKVVVPQINDEVTAATILQAIGMLGDNATDPCIIASGQTIADIRVAALSAGYAYDPFAGLTVIQKSGVTGAIVGDLAGVRVNMPEGENIKFKVDELSLAEQDLVKVVGRLYAAIAVVTPGMFVNITGESA